MKKLLNYLETTHPGNKIVREIAKNTSNMGHESIFLKPNPSNLQEEEICEGFNIIKISSLLDKYFYGLVRSYTSFLKIILKK